MKQAGHAEPAPVGNLAVGLTHLAQAAVTLALSNDFSLPVSAAFLAGSPGSDFTPRETVWNVPVGFAVLPWSRESLRRGMNSAR